MKHHIFFGRKAVIALFLPLLLAFTSANAHQVWLEPNAGGKGAKLFFGEFGGNLREASPGLLDKFVKPTAHHIAAGKAEPLTVAKSSSAFDIAGRIGVGQSLVAEEANYPISERKNGDQTLRSLYHPAARLVVDWATQTPRLKLDLVPTGRSDKSGHELKASFNGQPLPKAKVALVTASGWMQGLHTADDGTVRVQLPWRGTYVLELSHSDSSPGEREGQAFDQATYVTSLTVVQRQGLPALPAAPPAPPNKLN